jgi:hypothetical protein
MKDAADWPGYRVSQIGEVQSCRSTNGKLRDTWKTLKPCPRNGYPSYQLVRDRKLHHVDAHVLVLTTYVGPCPPGMVCRHLNGDRWDCRWPENLAWGTPIENMEDQRTHGTLTEGERNHASKFTEAQVLEIRDRLANGETAVSLAAEFSVRALTIRDIKHRRSWAHV